MARKPKTQPSLEGVSARRGRKPKAAAPSPGLPLAAGVGDPNMDDAGTGVPQAGPARVPGRRGPGRKPKQAVGAQAAPAAQDDAVGSQSQASPQPEAEAIPGLTKKNTPMAAAVSHAEAAADSDPVQPDFGLGKLDNEAAPSFSGTDASAPEGAAARWDRATSRVQFDWPAIERAATQDGPNQGMAKLLVAARAEGAQSRWPF